MNGRFREVLLYLVKILPNLSYLQLNELVLRSQLPWPVWHPLGIHGNRGMIYATVVEAVTDSYLELNLTCQVVDSILLLCGHYRLLSPDLVLFSPLENTEINQVIKNFRIKRTQIH